MKIITITIHCPWATDDTVIFQLQLHRRDAQQEFAMEVEEFYQKWTGTVPEAPHYELQIVSLPPDAAKMKLHVHTVGKDQFVCWTSHVPDQSEAEHVAYVWALGSAYTIRASGTPFDKMLYRQDIGGNIKKFTDALENEFNIYVKSVETK
jgi:hypothetical protein